MSCAAHTVRFFARDTQWVPQQLPARHHSRVFWGLSKHDAVVSAACTWFAVCVVCVHTCHLRIFVSMMPYLEQISRRKRIIWHDPRCTWQLEAVASIVSLLLPQSRPLWQLLHARSVAARCHFVRSLRIRPVHCRDLHGNALSGTIPAALGGMGQLQGM